MGNNYSNIFSSYASLSGCGMRRCNKIEHRLFSSITMNWLGNLFISHEVMLNLIANTKMKTGCSVMVYLGNREYLKGIMPRMQHLLL
jgi:hypothetical protein